MPRPRILYAAVFAWLSIAGGRFIAPFLKHEAGFSDTLIGIVLALQTGVSAFLATIGGSVADVMEQKYPNRGRSYVVVSGTTAGGCFFLMHGLWRLLPNVTFLQSTWWHIALRLCFASAASIVNPVLDGLTLAHLKADPDLDQSDYGKERLYGAGSWGLTNLIMGAFLDYMGYPAIYLFNAIATLLSIVAVYLYTQDHVKQGGSVIGDAVDLVGESRKQPQSNTKQQSTIHQQEEQRSHAVAPWILLTIMFGSAAAAGFFFSFFCLSSGFSVVENLVFLFFEFLGGSNSLNGLTVALTVVFEIPIFQVAPMLLRKFGPFVLLQVANVAFILRVIGYTLIPEGHVYLVLLLEPLHGVIYGCSQSGAVDYVSQLMPLGSEACGQGLLYLVRGVGGIVGVSTAGMLQEEFGPRAMYRAFAAIVAMGAVVFVIAGTRRRQSHAETEPLVRQSSGTTDYQATATSIK